VGVVNIEMEPEQLQKQLEVLEARVQGMIVMMRGLKKENAGLEAKLTQREKEWTQAQEEKKTVRLRIENILDTLNKLGGNGMDTTQGKSSDE